MTEDEFQQMVKERAFTEYKLIISVEARCGGDNPGEVSNAIESQLRELLPRNGIMVDSLDIGWPLEEVKR